MEIEDAVKSIAVVLAERGFCQYGFLIVLAFSLKVISYQFDHRPILQSAIRDAYKIIKDGLDLEREQGNHNDRRSMPTTPRPPFGEDALEHPPPCTNPGEGNAEDP